jgi:3-hydroxy-9,10-secoandrosta-1,3,5(10)-triene-9,17-dione monooxygenase
VIVGGVIEGDSARKAREEPKFFAVERSEGKIVDDWFVTGLEGTGSKSFELEDAIIPEHRVLDVAASVAGNGPGLNVNHAAVFKLPRFNFTASGFSALVVGMAKGLFADWQDFIAKKQLNGASATTFEHIQIAAATCAAELDAAERLYMTTIRRVMKMLEAGESPSDSFGFEGRRDCSYSCQLALAAVNRIHGTFGASTMYVGNPMERQYRNILAASQHISTNWPSSAVGYARDMFAQHAAPRPTA